MKLVMNKFVVALMIIFLIFRVFVVVKAQSGEAFIVSPIDINVEIGLIFISFICILLVMRRLKVGGVIYALTFFAYFGVDIYNQIMKVFTDSEFNLNIGMNFISSIFGIIMGILALMNIASYNVKVEKDVKTEWFYDNKSLDREKDKRDDNNNYRIILYFGVSMKKIFAIVFTIILISFIIVLLLKNVVYRKYRNSDFGIKTYVSQYDRDNDGVDDQTDILNNVKKYILQKPKYKSKYYETGYPNDKYGVCTDVIGYGLKNAGYDLRNLVNEDIIKNMDKYNIDKIDKNIDFRRVRNLNVYFKNNCISLTTDLKKIEEWQGGDIVVFKDHIGLISDNRNKRGIPYLIHHASVTQLNYEEDVLEFYGQDYIIGHYRVN